MRILVLSKRQYMDRDLIDDRYGRFRELPLDLASRGHEISGICLSYRKREEGRFNDNKDNAKVVWHMLNAGRLLPWSTNSYSNTIDSIGKDFHPDLVWTCSDALHSILGKRVAKKLSIPLIIDLYDNFESYSATHIPGVTMAFRRALRFADGITCISHPLARYVHQTSLCTCPIEIIENAVPDGLFQPMNKANARRELGLPLNGIVIGTAGAISKSRGIETLFKAFEILTQERTDIHLVLAGSCDKGLVIPINSHTHYLGMLPSEKVPVFISCLDIFVICNRESEFGKYCFPQKFYESVACEVPVAVAATAPMKELLKDNPECLFKPEDANDLMTVLHHQIENPVVLPMKAPTWKTQGQRLDEFFRSCLTSY